VDVFFLKHGVDKGDARDFQSRDGMYQVVPGGASLVAGGGHWAMSDANKVHKRVQLICLP